jgi:prepilin-type processing-associated H-X9-DG protein
MTDDTALNLTSAQPRAERWRLRVVIVVLLLMAIGGGYLFFVDLPRAREQAHLKRCHKQLQAIGQAMMLYANENRGSFPGDLKRVIITQDITSSIFICPSSNDTRAQGENLQAIARDLLAGGHCSYVYVGNSSLHWSMPENLVLAYELPGHHPTGSHILFGDLHVELVSPATTEKMLAELKTGHNPPRAEKLQ